MPDKSFGHSLHSELQPAEAPLKILLKESGYRNEKENIEHLENFIRTGEWHGTPHLQRVLEYVKDRYDEYFGPGAIKDVPGFWLQHLKLRFQAHRISHADLLKRAEVNPFPTPEERAAFTFYEELEPHVRAAVFALRRKGYPTSVSGFFPSGLQEIRFEDKAGGKYDIHFTESFRRGLRVKYGVALKYENNSISFLVSRPLTLEVLRDIWDQIEREIPDRGKPVPVQEIENPELKAIFK